MKPDPQTEARHLRAKLEMVIQYLERLDLYYHAHGADFRPQGWDITVQELIRRLKDDQVATADANRPAEST